MPGIPPACRAGGLGLDFSAGVVRVSARCETRFGSVPRCLRRLPRGPTCCSTVAMCSLASIMSDSRLPARRTLHRHARAAFHGDDEVAFAELWQQLAAEIGHERTSTGDECERSEQRETRPQCAKSSNQSRCSTFRHAPDGFIVCLGTAEKHQAHSGCDRKRDGQRGQDAEDEAMPRGPKNRPCKPDIVEHGHEDHGDDEGRVNDGVVHLERPRRAPRATFRVHAPVRRFRAAGAGVFDINDGVTTTTPIATAKPPRVNVLSDTPCQSRMRIAVAARAGSDE